jgi:hypothetical protein
MRQSAYLPCALQLQPPLEHLQRKLAAQQQPAWMKASLTAGLLPAPPARSPRSLRAHVLRAVGVLLAWCWRAIGALLTFSYSWRAVEYC